MDKEKESSKKGEGKYNPPLSIKSSGLQPALISLPLSSSSESSIGEAQNLDPLNHQKEPTNSLLIAMKNESIIPLKEADATEVERNIPPIKQNVEKERKRIVDVNKKVYFRKSCDEGISKSGFSSWTESSVEKWFGGKYSASMTAKDTLVQEYEERLSHFEDQPQCLNAAEVYLEAIEEAAPRIDVEIKDMISITDEEIKSFQILLPIHTLTNLGSKPQDLIFNKKGNLDNLEESDNVKTLVLDLDDTLIHTVTGLTQKMIKTNGMPFTSKNGLAKFYVRPGAHAFIEHMSKKCELLIFTAAKKSYANDILNTLDPNRHIPYRLTRQNCAGKGRRLAKDVRILKNRNPKNIIAVDNEPCYWSQESRDNLIPISNFEGHEEGKVLEHLEEYLNMLFEEDDIRVSNRKYFYKKYIKKDQIDLVTPIPPQPLKMRSSPNVRGRRPFVIKSSSKT